MRTTPYSAFTPCPENRHGVWEQIGGPVVSRRLQQSVISLAILVATNSCCHSRNESSKRILVTIKGNTGSVTLLAFSPDGKRIASSHCEQPGRTESEDPRVKPSGERAEFNALRELKIWDARSGDEQISIKEQGPTSAIAFFPDSKTLAGAVGKD